MVVLSIAGLLTPSSSFGQTPTSPDVQPIRAADPGVVAPSADKKLFQELNLLRRSGFERAGKATVSVRVVDSHDNRIRGLGESDFLLTINGTMRKVRIVNQSKTTTPEKPMVMLVFPPNQPTIHYIAVRDCLRYFTGLPAETLPWKVGLFDANGVFTSFTDQRSQLMANLEVLRTANEPAQYSSDRILARNAAWDGNWLTRANDAITEMQREPGPKLIMAMNPLGASTESFHVATLSQGNDQGLLVIGGPAQLSPIAQAIGAHIYIANVGGPEPIVPGGSAASGASTWGTAPSMNQRISPAQTAALNYYAAQTSQMLLTAEATLGGASNSIAELAAKMQNDLDSAYQLQFDMTPDDQDQGIPEVMVKINRSGLRAAILDVAPVVSADLNDEQRHLAESAHALLASMAKPVVSADFDIRQRVDYFPVRAGMESVLPMSCLITWKGKGEHPGEIVIAESVVDQDLNVPLLERKMDSTWSARSVFWERDGQLRPGRYVWRVAVGDQQGRILASAQRNVTIEFPRNPAVAVSSLVIGKACKSHVSANGLRQRPAKGSPDQTATQLTVDPLQLGNCRFLPEPGVQFQQGETLRALLRIYPIAKLEKNRPETWSARFTILSATGSPEGEQQIAFAADSGSGLVASAAWQLTQPGMTTGSHTVRVEIAGPGIKKPLSQAEAFSIEP